jgi:hypothetical protein
MCANPALQQVATVDALIVKPPISLGKFKSHNLSCLIISFGMHGVGEHGEKRYLGNK